MYKNIICDNNSIEGRGEEDIQKESFCLLLKLKVFKFNCFIYEANYTLKATAKNITKSI